MITLIKLINTKRHIFCLGIISRASAARGGQLFDNDMDRDSISNSDIGRPVVWNVTHEDSPEDSRGLQRSKKLSWSNGAGPIVVNGHKVKYS